MDRVPLILTYSRASPDIGKILNSHQKIIKVLFLKTQKERLTQRGYNSNLIEKQLLKVDFFIIFW
jgi:hypothetical protein